MKCTKYILRNVQRVIYQAQIFRYDTNFGSNIQNAQQTRYKSQIIQEIFRGPDLHEMYNESDRSIRTYIEVLSMWAGYSEMYKRTDIGTRYA
jgi:hypothetical protein